MKHCYIYFTLILLLFASCSKRLDYEVNDAGESEVVNGFTIQWSDGISEEKKDVIRNIVNDMVYVDGGIFTMGANWEYDPEARDNEGPAHHVLLSDYYICSHELTVEQVACLFDYPSDIVPKHNRMYVDYNDLKLLIDYINESTGLSFDFPTEAQWEFAARGGNRTHNFRYPGSNDWDEVWSDGGENSTPSISNELGIFNMADGRSEWCKDVYAMYNRYELVENPCNMYAQDYYNLGFSHVVRGGCSRSKSTSRNWFPYTSYDDFDDIRMCRSTARSRYEDESNEITLRPVINIPDYEQ